MSASTSPQPVTCGMGGCRGVELSPDHPPTDPPLCIVHTNDVEARYRAVAELAEGGDLWFVRGVQSVSYTHLTLPTTPYV